MISKFNALYLTLSVSLIALGVAVHADGENNRAHIVPSVLHDLAGR